MTERHHRKLVVLLGLFYESLHAVGAAWLASALDAARHPRPDGFSISCSNSSSADMACSDDDADASSPGIVRAPT